MLSDRERLMNRLLNKARRKHSTEETSTETPPSSNGSRRFSSPEVNLRASRSSGSGSGSGSDLGPDSNPFGRRSSASSVSSGVNEDPFHDSGLQYQDITRNRVLATDEYDISPTASMPLSEGETLNEDKRERLELQDTYNENFDSYLPFLLRRMRVSSLREQGHVTAQDPVDLVDNDDQPTVLDEPIGNVVNDGTTTTIMNSNTSNFNMKRRFIIVSEFIKSNTFIFASEESFNMFKELRANNKKHRKSSTTLYDNDGSVKILRNQKASGRRGSNTEIIDSRNHIIPMDYKSRGLGLPLFKLVAPYMSNFKKTVPFLIFHKYKETPEPPKLAENGDIIEEEFETFPFCTVYMKKFLAVKRYTFEFMVEEDPEDNVLEKETINGKTPRKPNKTFKLLVFQHCFKPFTDFIYKGTRFRVLGTPIVSAYAMSYNPTLKLLVLDHDQNSLCDKIINKKPGFEFSSLIKSKKERLKNKQQNELLQKSLDGLDPREYPNPYPSEECGLFTDNYFQYFDGTGYMDLRNYIPNNMPPFGLFKDALLYKNNMKLLPKRYTDTGRIELYQENGRNLIGDTNFFNPNLAQDQQHLDEYKADSTKSVDIDSQILMCVLLTLRESAIRATARPSNTSTAINSRLGGELRAPGASGLFIGSDVAL